MIPPVAALFVRADSHYKEMPGVDSWDMARDARLWPGGCPVVVHPPCRAWGRLRQFAKPRPDERELAGWAVARVRQWGGVLEHPEASSLWGHQGLPRPGELPDEFGGYTVSVDQYHWGHRAEKSTWLYIVGVARESLPLMPWREGRPTHCVRPTKSYPRLPSITKRERELSPEPFARWLIAVARQARR